MVWRLCDRHTYTQPHPQFQKRAANEPCDLHLLNTIPPSLARSFGLQSLVVLYTNMVSAQFWVFPPQEPSNTAEICNFASDFGPVYLDDKIVLHWIDDDATKDIKLACCTYDGTIETNATSTPWTFQFTAHLMPGLNESDAGQPIACHFVSTIQICGTRSSGYTDLIAKWGGRKNGNFDNTVVFPYLNFRGDEAVTWSATATTTALSTTTTGLSTSVTSAERVTASSTSNPMPTPTSDAASHGLSKAAEGGIAVGAVLGLLLVGCAAYMYHKIHKVGGISSESSELALIDKTKESDVRSPSPPAIASLSSHHQAKADGNSSQSNGDHHHNQYNNYFGHGQWPDRAAEVKVSDEGPGLGV